MAAWDGDAVAAAEKTVNAQAKVVLQPQRPARQATETAACC